MLATALTVMAIVTQDQAQLRAAPKDSAPQQAMLWQGDSLEIRGEKRDYLQVYDHRRERAGYIKASQVRLVSLKPEGAAETLAVLRFVRDTPGSESLGISYAAAYLKAAPANMIGPEVFDALGTMAERLARRASMRANKSSDASESKIAAHLDTVAQYGIKIDGYERDGRMQLCYDGEAYRRVLALHATAQQNAVLTSNAQTYTELQKARAALGLTRPECIDPALPPLQKIALDNWRAEILDTVVEANLPDYMKNRIHMRRANVWASIAYQRSRKAEGYQAAGQRAINALASVDKNQLPDEDQARYTEAAVHVSSVRWAAEAIPALQSASPRAALQIHTEPGAAGETCVSLIQTKGAAKENVLIKRCSYGVVWAASSNSNPAGTALTLAVQPLDGWRELWLFRQSANGWVIDVLPPAASAPDVGYAEFAGWVPASNKMLVVREARVEGRFKRSFEVLNMDNLQVDAWADRPGAVNLFARWQEPQWKRSTLSLR